MKISNMLNTRSMPNSENIRLNFVLKRILLKNRYQLLMGLFLAIGLPLLARYILTVGDDFTSFFQGFLHFLQIPTNYNTALGITLSVILGFFLHRQLAIYPGSNIGRNVWISYGVPYLALILILIFFRIEYNRFVLLTSFVMSAMWFSVLQYVLISRNRDIFAIIPGGQVSRLTQTNIGLKWVHQKEPNQIHADATAIVADLRYNLSAEWQSFIAKCALRNIPVYHFKQVEEFTTGRVSIEHLSENSLGSIVPSLIYIRMKVILDVLFCLLITPAVIIISLFVAALIWITAGRPIFFIQDRVGYQGTKFRMIKFRTMRSANDKEGNNCNQTHQPNDALNAQSAELLDTEYAKTKHNDTRLIKFGKFLRKYRIDELPQIINIYRGEMSWIGPRPEALALSKHYEASIPFYSYRHIVRPGITGWAQVNQGHVTEVEDVSDKLNYDFFYIKNISLWLDTVIALRTVFVLLRGIGAK